jgi:predicted amidohydrolase
MARLMTVALAQLTPALGDPETNLRRALECVTRAKGVGADLLMLPELHLQGYRADELFAEQAETIPGPSSERLAKAAAEAGMFIVMGMARRDEAFPHAVYNSLVFVGPHGLIGCYDKIHLGTFHPYTEGVYFAGGKRAPVFDTPFGKASLQICYDAFFPELTRHYALQGAELNLVISAGPSGFVEGWSVALRQRATENLMWTIYCNTVGNQKDFSFFGGSKVVNPMGKVIAEAAIGKEDFLIATIDLDEATLLRRQRLTFRDVQPWLLKEMAEYAGN